MNNKETFKYSITFLKDELYILSKAPKNCTEEIRKELEKAIRILSVYKTDCINFDKSEI